jgi:hypothetical protein
MGVRKSIRRDQVMFLWARTVAAGLMVVSALLPRWVAGGAEMTREVGHLPVPLPAPSMELPERRIPWCRENVEYDVKLTAMLSAEIRIAEEVKGSYIHTDYLFSYRVTQISEGTYEEPDLTFIVTRRFPTPESGIKLKELWPFRKDLPLAFKLRLREPRPAIVSIEPWEGWSDWSNGLRMRVRPAKPVFSAEETPKFITQTQVNKPIDVSIPYLVPAATDSIIGWTTDLEVWAENRETGELHHDKLLRLSIARTLTTSPTPGSVERMLPRRIVQSSLSLEGPFIPPEAVEKLREARKMVRPVPMHPSLRNPLKQLPPGEYELTIQVRPHSKAQDEESGLWTGTLEVTTCFRIADPGGKLVGTLVMYEQPHGVWHPTDTTGVFKVVAMANSDHELSETEIAKVRTALGITYTPSRPYGFGEETVAEVNRFIESRGGHGVQVENIVWAQLP